MSAGLFISLEGADGSGKTSNGQWLLQTLQQRGIRIQMTREPGGTPLAESLRALLLQGDGKTAEPEVELMLMFAARLQHVRQRIQPALQAGQHVLCDRFTDASFAYQGGGSGVAWTRLQALEQWTLQGFVPDMTLLLDAPLSVLQQRTAQRAHAADRFEQEQSDFHARVRQAYRRRAAEAPERFIVLDASQDQATVQRAMLDAVLAVIEGRR